MRSRAALALATVFALALPAAAQTTIYKVRYPDGTIGFTDKPPPNAKVLEAREPGKDTNVIPAPARSSERSSATTSRTTSALDAAQAEIIAAEAALEDAKARQAAGKEFQPAERLGLAGGGTRASPAYEARQKALADAVTAAEARVQQAYEARRAAR